MPNFLRFIRITAQMMQTMPTFAFFPFTNMLLMNRFRTVWLCCLLLIVHASLEAQKPVDLKKSGEKYYANGRWQDCFDALNQYQEQKPGDPQVLTHLGVAAYHLHKTEQAQKYLDYVLAQNPNSSDPELYYFLARTLHGTQEYERAILFYKRFLKVCGERHILRASIPDQIRRCLSGMALPVNNTVALVENMGDQVNTAGDEFAPLLSVNHANRIYFAAAKPETVGGLRNDAGYEDPEAGHWSSDMFVTNLKTSGWEIDATLGSLLNTSRNEVPLGFNESGQILYFFRGFTLYSGEVLVDTAGRKDEYAVQPPAFVSPMQPALGDATPFFVNDTFLIFASRRAGGFGGLDLYYTTFRDTTWSPAVNFGPMVNGSYDELSPFLAADGRTLYFSSNRTESAGGLDVYKSVFEDGKIAWQAAVNLGSPINSPGDDAYFRLSDDGSTGFLASDRLDSYGARDLYVVYFKTALPEQSTASAPALFTAVGKSAATQTQVSDRAHFEMPVLYYDTDRDLVRGENLKAINQLAAVARQYPETYVLVTVHTDETGPAKFDLYNGIKRAELIGKALTDGQVSGGQILLRSCGAAYPKARNVLDAAPNPIGQKLNRRAEITLVVADGTLPLDFQLEQTPVSELMAAKGAQVFENQTKGLFYKVEVATARQILNSEPLLMFSDLMIESQPGTGAYRYTAGLMNQFSKAQQLKAELVKQGFQDATVVAYLNGIRISKAEAVGLLKKYPDLAAFIKN